MASNLFALGLLLSILAVLLPTSILKSIGQTTKATTPSPGICQLPRESGPCMAYLPRWHFNHKTKKCQQFIYGGCGANGNNFPNEAECLLACGVGSQQAIKPVTSAAPKVTETRKKADNKTLQYNPPNQKPTVNTSKSNKPCEVEKRKALALNKSGMFVPECNNKGNYRAKQCWKPLGLPHRCWCVNHRGNKIGEVRKNKHGKETCKPLKKKFVPGDGLCSQVVNTYYKTLSQQILSTLYIPQCDGSGLFTPLQCHQGYCWCADINYGAKIKNTRGKKGTVKCTHT